ncbi:CobW family GTP-binding protein [Saccharopolyspora cebuensis]|uniref:CobW family GTP-binding protein n=1 Tax=Saccharopolyspora cebuensis TaxID=418759 RepID=A0ABV4CGQ2_9PSEU
MSRKKVPVLVVAGFLGAGKTTLLNHLLRHPRGARIGVVVNDFGKIGIDAMSVAGQVDAAVSLSNGCLCCAVDPEGLDEMLGRLTRRPIDVVVVESSGLADPRVLIKMLLNSTDERISYGGLVEVVDAAEFATTRRDHPELDGHLRFADLVLLNKADRAADLDGVLRLVRELAGGTPVLPTSHGRVDPELLVDARAAPVAQQLSFDELLADDEDDHPHAAYQSVEFSTAEPLHPRRFMRFLDERPAGVYRMKGFVHFGPADPRAFSVHTVGNFVRFAATRRPATPGTHLVLIGAGIDADRLHADLAACRGVPDDTDEHAMLDVLRYLR